ncbi:MAG TPA: lipopolysaccharide kinase InaA family protein [Gemmataceae bacterium]|nr:lipopolysaccharide kinase InaA family protein [Gemmataceae bacterium]
MAFVRINPRYRDFLARHGLTAPGHFLDLPGVIISGHPDRHVCQVTVGGLRALLKREHRVPVKDRLAGAAAGYGLVSKSYREALTLQALKRAGVPCPEWLAAGEDERGRAFLLVKEVAGGLDLRLFLRDRLAASPAARRRFARRLGEALARIHRAGFDHPDLCSKHVLVEPHRQTIVVVDWQRSRRRRRLSWQRRCRDLALLHATLADELATPRDRLACLRAYLRVGGESKRRRLARAIHRQAQRFLRRRHVREQRQAVLAAGTQNLIWVDGEALCVTREFLADCGGQVPAWLRAAGRPEAEGPTLTQTVVAIPGARQARLVCRRSFRPWGYLWAWLRRRPLPSPELLHAGLLFRLQRYGIRTPRLLAVGQRWLGIGRMSSFLVTEPIAGAIALGEWLVGSGSRWRRQLLQEAGALLRRLHDAGCSFGGKAATVRDSVLLIQHHEGELPALALGDVEGLKVCRRPGMAVIMRDLRALASVLSAAGWVRTDLLRLLLGYLGQDRLLPSCRPLARWLLTEVGPRTESLPAIASAGAPRAWLSLTPSGR